MGQPAGRAIVIVGGGTAGWLCAGILAAEFARKGWSGLQITLIEPANSQAIGVGEGTWPTMRGSLHRMGVSEREFLSTCNASFKQGSRFVDWAGPGHRFDHPFTPPQGFDGVSASELWASEGGLSYAEFCSIQPALCDADKAPKLPDTPDFQGNLNYGYHLDAGRFGAFLRDHCITRLNVGHRVAGIARVELDDAGSIAALHTDDGDAVTADLFIDCTGFNAALIGDALRSPWRDCTDSLFVDSALAYPLDFASPDEPIASCTLSIARPAGWIWDIALQSRRGIGHVFSSTHMSDNEAARILCDYVGAAGGKVDESRIRKLSFTSGYRTEAWRGNCVAIGLAMGFVEPLEASSLLMTELAAQLVAALFPCNAAEMPSAARQFNRRVTTRWDEIIDFLKLHYVLSDRTEPFWRDNRDMATLSPRLRDWLDAWKHRMPVDEDFYPFPDTFPIDSFRYVLLGMGKQPDIPRWRRRVVAEETRSRYAARSRAVLDQVRHFPTNRAALGEATGLLV